MRICYVLLSPTWGMHEYTADLVTRRQAAGDDVDLVTTSRAPREPYAPGISIHMPVSLTNTGFSLEGMMRLPAVPRVAREIRSLRPDVVHFTGPHLWNPLLVDRLHAAGARVVHTLHDLHPHLGAAYGRLLYLWNGRVQRAADHLLVHGQLFRDELIEHSVPASRVTCALLTFPFVSNWVDRCQGHAPTPIQYEPFALFAGRLARYKGIGVLVEAATIAGVRVCIAGPGSAQRLLPPSLPDNVQLRNQFIDDADLADLFRRCGVVVLPYLEASQSALVAAAYFYQKPVIVTEAGALPEYVIEGATGWIVPEGDASALASALREALRDPGRLSVMGHIGRAWWERQRRAESGTLDEMYRSVRGANPLAGQPC
jgi:glycosyltransferase involved in cell wall biosynthesis